MIKNLQVQLNEAGKIKIGKKGTMITSQGGAEFRPPKKLDHFQLVTTEKDKNGDYIIDVALQNKIKQAGTGLVNENGCLIGLPIRLLYNDDELNFPTRYVSYVSGKMSCHGDGEQSFKRVDNFKTPHPCPCERCDQAYQGKDKCKPTGTLTCVIDEAGLFGQAHKFRTTSMNTIKGILGGIHLIKTTTNGKIAGLPLMLTMNAKQTTTPQGVATTVYIVSICYRGNMEDLRQEVLKLVSTEKQFLLSMETIEDQARKAMAESEDIIDIGDDEQDFVEEFFPDAVVKDGEVYVHEAAAIHIKEPVEAEKEVVTLEQIQDGYQEHVNNNNDTTREPGSPKEGVVIDKMLEPVGPYKKIYDSFLVEKDIDKAMALAGRLQKPNILYFLHSVNCTVPYQATMLKPELLDVLKVHLETKETEEVIEETKVTTPADPGNIFGDNTPDVFADGSIEEIAPDPEQEKQLEVNQANENTVNEGPGPKETVNPEPEKNEPEPEKTEPPKKEKIPQEWDQSGPILKDQLRQLVALKRTLEEKGILQSDKWTLHVNYFLDKDRKPIDKAINLTKKQGANLVLVLENALKNCSAK